WAGGGRGAEVAGGGAAQVGEDLQGGQQAAQLVGVVGMGGGVILRIHALAFLEAVGEFLYQVGERIAGGGGMVAAVGGDHESFLNCLVTGSASVPGRGRGGP